MTGQPSTARSRDPPQINLFQGCCQSQWIQPCSALRSKYLQINYVNVLCSLSKKLKLYSNLAENRVPAAPVVFAAAVLHDVGNHYVLMLSLLSSRSDSAMTYLECFVPIQRFSIHRLRVSGLNRDTRARPPLRLPKALMSLSEVLATAMASRSNGIAMQAMIKYFRPPNEE